MAKKKVNKKVEPKIEIKTKIKEEPKIVIEKMEVKQVSLEKPLLCPRCNFTLKHIKNSDFVCEQGHGWSGFPPPKVT